MSELIDLSHTIESGMITYKGIPAPIVCDFLTREESTKQYAPGTSFHIGKVEMAANTGTYIDAPFHRYADGLDIAELSLESIAQLPAVLISTEPHDAAIDQAYFEGLDVSGKAVLVNTNWSRHWRQDQYFENHPHLTEQAAIYLRDQGAVLVGIDSYNIDDTNSNSRPVHSVLLAAGIPIVEHMTNLAVLTGRTFVFSAVPCKIKAMGTFPVRAYAYVS